VTQEVRLFARMSAFGLIAGAVYWFLTYETAGTVLLLGFGLAAGIAAIAVFVGGRAARRRGSATPGGSRPAEPASLPPGLSRSATASVEPVPRPGWAPIGLAIGLGAVALGGAFGPFPAIGGVVIAVVSAGSWLGSAMHETDDARAIESRAAESPGSARTQPERDVSSPRS
jgi:hypothetical protein